MKVAQKKLKVAQKMTGLARQVAPPAIRVAKSPRYRHIF